MTDEKTTGQGKKPYEKPGVQAIDLVAEEVLGIACKAGPGSCSTTFGAPIAAYGS